MPKNVQITIQLLSFHMLTRLGLQSFELGLSSVWTKNFQMYEMDLEKDRGTRDQITNICWIIGKEREFQKNIYFCFIDYAKALAVWITTNCGKFFKGWKYQTTLLATWETCMQVKKQQSESHGTMVHNWERSTSRLLVYCHPASLTYMQIISWKIPG